MPEEIKLTLSLADLRKAKNYVNNCNCWVACAARRKFKIASREYVCVVPGTITVGPMSDRRAYKYGPSFHNEIERAIERAHLNKKDAKPITLMLTKLW